MSKPNTRKPHIKIHKDHLEAERSEAEVQRKILDVLEQMGLVHFFINNGADISDSQRIFAAAQGVMVGVPDLFVCEPFDFEGVHFNGMFIEVKSTKTTARMGDLQPEWASVLRERGYWVISGFGGIGPVLTFLALVYRPRILPAFLRRQPRNPFVDG